jgi:hypothetical protein
VIVKAPSWGPFKDPTCVFQVPPTTCARLPQCVPVNKCHGRERRCIAPVATKIILPTQIPSLNKYGPKTLRPPGSRSPLTEAEYIARRVLEVNGMSGQLV